MAFPYIQPSSSQGLPGNLDLTQFIQTVLVGISAINGDLVRPKFQVAPPKQPGLLVNWMAFTVNLLAPDTNAYLGVKQDGSSDFQRQQAIEVGCSIYGPLALENASLLCDGFQIPQNLEALFLANMGFVETTEPRLMPDLVHERFINRVELTIRLRRQVQRTYPITTLISANGQVHTVLGTEEYLFNWQTPDSP